MRLRGNRSLASARPDRLASFHFIPDAPNAASLRLGYIHPYKEDEECKETREDQKSVLMQRLLQKFA